MATQKRSKKHGRSKRTPANAAYNAEMRWLKNKRKKLERYVSKNPNDQQAASSLKKILKGEKGVKGKRRQVRTKPWTMSKSSMGKGLLLPYDSVLNKEPKGVQVSDSTLVNGHLTFVYRQ